MYIVRIGTGDYFVGWYLSYAIFTDNREDAMRISEESINDTIPRLVQMGYAVTPLEV